MKRQNNHSARSSLDGPATNSRTWNIMSQTMPMFNNTLKKDNSVHKFIQTTDLTTVFTSSTTNPVGYARSFTFADLAQYTSFSTIFDQYKITDIEVWLSPGFTNSSSFTPGTSGYLYTVTDYDDDTTPSSVTNLQQYTNCIMTPGFMGHYRRWKPHVAEALYSGAFSSYGNISAPWIDIASNSVKHYGFKAMVAPAASSATVVSYQLTMRLHFECRNVF